MTGYERFLATLDGSPVDSLPLMSVTMMFAADQNGVPYGKYAADHRVLVETQTDPDVRREDYRNTGEGMKLWKQP